MSEAKAYVIVQIVIKDVDGYRQYGSAPHLEIFEKFKGTLICADDDVEIIEGAWPFMRTVVIEFKSKEFARAWYESPEYQEVVGLRHGSASSNLVIAAGYPG